MTFRIRRSRVDDAPRLPAIEHSAGDLFRTIADLAWIADGDGISVERHLQLIDQGTSWVGEAADGQVVAFLCAETMGDALHVWELAVTLNRQRMGIGKALMMHAIDFARQRPVSSVTLTTFLAIPWNEPAYCRMGFQTLAPSDYGPRLAAILRREAEAGLPPERRCAMRLTLEGAGERLSQSEIGVPR